MWRQADRVSHPEGKLISESECSDSAVVEPNHHLVGPALGRALAGSGADHGSAEGAHHGAGGAGVVVVPSDGAAEETSDDSASRSAANWVAFLPPDRLADQLNVPVASPFTTGRRSPGGGSGRSGNARRQQERGEEQERGELGLLHESSLCMVQAISIAG